MVARISHFQTHCSDLISRHLIQHTGIGESQAHQLLKLGAVFVNKRRIEHDIVVCQGQLIRAHLQPKRYEFHGDFSSLVMAEMPDWLVVNKPKGLPVHAMVDNSAENLISLLSQHRREQLWVTHRLDVETTGLMVLARNSSAQRQVNLWIANKQIIRRYRALVQGAPKAGFFEHYMKKSPRAPKEVSTLQHPDWLKCNLEIRHVTELKNDISEIEVELKTGRTHQIRAQLAALGHPICGDTLYGASVRAQGLALQSFWIAVPGPNYNHIFEVPRPWKKLDNRVGL